MALTVEQKAKIVSEYGINDKDTGSVDVQVALITERLKDLQGHFKQEKKDHHSSCLLYTSPSPRDKRQSRMPSSA